MLVRFRNASQSQNWRCFFSTVHRKEISKAGDCSRRKLSQQELHRHLKEAAEVEMLSLSRGGKKAVTPRTWPIKRGKVGTINVYELLLHIEKYREA